MFSIRRSAARSARQVLPRSSRRYASHDHGHSAHADHHHAEPVKEGFGKSFYIAFGTPILFYVLYQLNQTTPDSRPFISRLIEKYTEKQDAYQKRTELHMKAVEQAAFDKQLFKTEDKTGLSRGINLRHPEQFNNGSPYNVSAGQSGADLSKLVAYYREKNEQAEDLRTSKVRDNNGKVRSVYETTPIEGAVKATPHT